MKRIILCLALLAVVVFNFACSTTHELKKSGTYSFQADPIKVKYNVTLGKEIRGEATVSKFVMIIVPFSRTVADNVYYTDSSEKENIVMSMLKPLTNMLGGNIVELAKASAAYNACKDGNFDVIIAPVYEVVYNDYLIFKTVTAKVRGRGAYLTDVAVENQIKKNEVPQIIPAPAAVAPRKPIDKTKNYFLMLNNQKYGPVSAKQIEDLKNMGYCNNDSVIIEPETNAQYKVSDLL